MNRSIVVAGHLCLDIIPSFQASGAQITPGSLSEVGAATLATGGGVSNVGLSLLRLGIPAKFMGKVGDDAFGGIVMQLLKQHHKAAQAIIVAPGETTSYSIVISLPGNDRSFLHHPGCNDSFSSIDVDLDVVADSTIFYLGYPPLMRRFYEDEGEKLAELLARIKQLGVATALDMAMPDPATDSGKVDWPKFLQRVLPHVDIFMPSFDEIRFMLDRVEFDARIEDATAHTLETERLIANILIEMGAAIVGLTRGEYGLYLRTAGQQRLEQVGSRLSLATQDWEDRELWTPVFKVDAQGTTGSGDATMAGFLAGLMHGLNPERTATMAVAVGACSVEAPDATSGVRNWDETAARVEAGWEQAPGTRTNWLRDKSTGIYFGPNDKEGSGS
jgi:sugar/nucleoside kinase (ribokinase family)